MDNCKEGKKIYPITEKLLFFNSILIAFIKCIGKRTYHTSF